MQETLNSTVPTRKMSTQMNAVMTIVSACSDLTQVAGPFIDLQREEIKWDLIFKQCWSSSQKTALSWAFALWRDEPRARFNIFDGSTLMDQELQVAVLKALTIRWGISQKSIELFNQPNTILGGAA